MPSVADVVWQVALEPQPVLADHDQLVGVPLQTAVSVTLVPMVGVDVFAEIVHEGGGGGSQVTATEAGAPVPPGLEAVTVYVCRPAVGAVVVQVADTVVPQLVFADQAKL